MLTKNRTALVWMSALSLVVACGHQAERGAQPTSATSPNEARPSGAANKSSESERAATRDEEQRLATPVVEPAASPGDQAASMPQSAPPPSVARSQALSGASVAQAAPARKAAPTAIAGGGGKEKKADGAVLAEGNSGDAVLRDGKQEKSPARQADNDRYQEREDAPFLTVASAPLSTFSVDVDTASYANVRSFVQSGTLPPPSAVRLEEMVNYFDYDYPQPQGAHPLNVVSELSACPWAPEHQLLRIGVQAKSAPASERPATHLTFLLDVSGSMSDADKLPLLKRSLTMLAERVRPEDTVAIVVYAGAAGVVLEPTSSREQIKAALGRLQAGGSTHGSGGIKLAYSLARKGLNPKAVNRVILATDGDFNVGTTSDGELVRLIEEERKSGVFLTVLGFGRGNLNDSMMEKLADHGNGSYAYIDSDAEARKVLVEQGGATLVPVAKDVKLQVEMNPAAVASYRLLGYENRALRDRDFVDDKKDAGEVGLGQQVTALYELVPSGAANTTAPERRYVGITATPPSANPGEIAFVRVRYKLPNSATSIPFSQPVSATSRRATPSVDQQFAAGIASFAMTLRRGETRGASSFALAQRLAEAGQGGRDGARRSELLGLIAKAARVAPGALVAR